MNTAMGRIIRSPQAVWREIDGQVAIVSIDQSRVRLLNATGGFVWARCEGATATDLVAAVTEKFGIDAERARRDVEAFLVDLEKRGLITMGEP